MDNFDVQVVNNEFRRTGAASTPGVCETVVLVGHCFFTRLNVENNIIDAGEGAAGSCWNIDLRAAGSPSTHYREMTVRRNVVKGGGLGISVGQAPGVIIENNVVTQTQEGDWKVGIGTPQDTARDGQDDVEDNAVIRNNSIYITGNSPNYTGISVDFEGTGHIIANNAVQMESGTCFSTPLGAEAYMFIGNNACFGYTSWGTTFDELDTRITDDPLFSSAPTDFTPAGGSPLIGTGNPEYAASTDFMLKPRPDLPTIGAFEP